MNKRAKEKIKTPQGIRISDVITELGLSERSFALSVGYGHASTIYASEYGRTLSPKLSKRLVDSYRKEFNKELNPQWLLTGELPKLLTIKPGINESNLDGERTISYSNNCLGCIERDKKIELLRNKLELLQEEYNVCLKKLLALRPTG